MQEFLDTLPYRVGDSVLDEEGVQWTVRSFERHSPLDEAPGVFAVLDSEVTHPDFTKTLNTRWARLSN